MPLHSNPLHKSPERAFNLQKYLLLHSQHDALHTHLAALSASPSPTASPTSPTQPAAIASLSRPPIKKRRSSLPPSFPLSLEPDAAVESDEVLEEERKLVNVNLQIKTTLTELLNCESVRQDRLYCVWVQSRLMDAERELKEGRRHSVAAHWEERRVSWDGEGVRGSL